MCGLLRLSDTVAPSSEPSPHTNPSACPAARLSQVDRKDLAVQALAGTLTVTDLSGQHGVGRKFVYQQTSKASAALDEVFASSAPDGAVLFYLRSPRYGCGS